MAGPHGTATTQKARGLVVFFLVRVCLGRASAFRRPLDGRKRAAVPKLADFRAISIQTPSKRGVRLSYLGSN